MHRLRATFKPFIYVLQLESKLEKAKYDQPKYTTSVPDPNLGVAISDK